MSVSLDREQRDAIYEDVLIDLRRVAEIDLAIQHHDFEEARRLRCCFEDEMRLLDDIGWAREAGASSYEITMDPGQLLRMLRRLHRRTIEDLNAGLDGFAGRHRRNAGEQFTEDDDRLAAGVPRALAMLAVYGLLLAQVAEAAIDGEPEEPRCLRLVGRGGCGS